MRSGRSSWARPVPPGWPRRRPGSGSPSTWSGDSSRLDPAVPSLEVTRHTLDDPEVAAAWAQLQTAGHVPSPFLSWQWYSALRDVPELAAGVEVLVAHHAGEIL